MSDYTAPSPSGVGFVGETTTTTWLVLVGVLQLVVFPCFSLTKGLSPELGGVMVTMVVVFFWFLRTVLRFPLVLDHGHSIRKLSKADGFSAFALRCVVKSIPCDSRPSEASLQGVLLFERILWHTWDPEELGMYRQFWKVEAQGIRNNLESGILVKGKQICEIS